MFYPVSCMWLCRSKKHWYLGIQRDEDLDCRPLSFRCFSVYTPLFCACDSVAVKSTGIRVYGEVKIWTADHFHFLASLLILQLATRRVYDLAVEV